MPKPVSQVPEPWKDYMDGQIWEFTASEYLAMPRWCPMYESVTKEIVGKRMTVWVVQDMYYVVFSDAKDPDGWDVEKLAGWK